MLDIIIYAVLLCPAALIGYILLAEIRLHSLEKDVEALWRMLEEEDDPEV